MVLPARLRPFDPELGPGTCTLVLVFDNGYFSKFGTFSITAWMAANPDLLLSTNFGVPESMFLKFPKVALFMPK